MLYKNTVSRKFLFSCFWERVNFFSVLCGVSICSSHVSFVSLKFGVSKFGQTFWNWLISLVGPGSPTLTSTMSSPFGRTINWFFRVWFFCFPEKTFLALLDLKGVLWAVLYYLLLTNTGWVFREPIQNHRIFLTCSRLAGNNSVKISNQ